MPTSKAKIPPPAVADTPTLTKVLRPRKAKNLNPGTPDLPKARRTTAEVRAQKEKKEAKKEASATKTKAAKARVDGLREALRREQVDSNPHGPTIGLKKTQAGQGRTKKTPSVSSRVPKSKINPKLKEVSLPPSETTTGSTIDETDETDETMVSIEIFWS